jgi:hypothetical protein
MVTFEGVSIFVGPKGANKVTALGKAGETAAAGRAVGALDDAVAGATTRMDGTPRIDVKGLKNSGRRNVTPSDTEQGAMPFANLDDLGSASKPAGVLSGRSPGSLPDGFQSVADYVDQLPRPRKIETGADFGGKIGSDGTMSLEKLMEEVPQIARRKKNGEFVNEYHPGSVIDEFTSSGLEKDGFKYTFFNEIENVQYEVKFHIDDAGAPPLAPFRSIGELTTRGSFARLPFLSNSFHNWTVQIKRGRKLLGQDGRWHSQANNMTHIPIVP